MRTLIFHLTLLFLAVSGDQSLPILLPEPFGQDSPRQELFLSSAGVFRPPPDPRGRAWLEHEEEATILLNHPYSSIFQPPDDALGERITPLQPTEDISGFQSAPSGVVALIWPEHTTPSPDSFGSVEGYMPHLFFYTNFIEWLSDSVSLLPSMALLPSFGSDWPYDSDVGQAEWKTPPSGLSLKSLLEPLRFRHETNPDLAWLVPCDTECDESVSSSFRSERDAFVPADDMASNIDYDDEYDFEEDDLHWEESSWIDECVPFMPLPTLFPYHIPSGMSLAGRDHSGSTLSSAATESDMDLDGFSLDQGMSDWL